MEAEWGEHTVKYVFLHNCDSCISLSFSSKTPTNSYFSHLVANTKDLCLRGYGCVYFCWDIPPLKILCSPPQWSPRRCIPRRCINAHTHTDCLHPGLPLLCAPHLWRHTWAGRRRCHRPGGGCGCRAAGGEQSWHTPSAKHRYIHTD